MATIVVCPTAIVRAPIAVVWDLLTQPRGWGEFFDIRILDCDPSGSAVVGQRITAESGPAFLHLRLTFRFVEIDVAGHRLTLDIHLPFGMQVREELSCVPIDSITCRVNYHCNIGLPTGWRGLLAGVFLRREFERGPLDSLARLKPAAEARSA